MSPQEWADFLSRTAEDPGPDNLWLEYTVFE
jgi:hypothetical protein